MACSIHLSSLAPLHTYAYSSIIWISRKSNSICSIKLSWQNLVFAWSWKSLTLESSQIGLPQVKFITDLIYRVKDLMGAGIPGIIADHGILQQMVVLKDFGP